MTIETAKPSIEEGTAGHVQELDRGQGNKTIGRRREETDETKAYDPQPFDPKAMEVFGHSVLRPFSCSRRLEPVSERSRATRSNSGWRASRQCGGVMPNTSIKYCKLKRELSGRRAGSG